MRPATALVASALAAYGVDDEDDVVSLRGEVGDSCVVEGGVAPGNSSLVTGKRGTATT